MERVKISVVARGWVREEQAEHRDFQGNETSVRWWVHVTTRLSKTRRMYNTRAEP